MARYVDLDKLDIKSISYYDQDCNECVLLSDLANWLESLPTKELAKVTHGEWVYTCKAFGREFYTCSECGRQVDTNGEYTPEERFAYCHCGAKMTTRARDKAND